jgi:rhodanese-related sulfurtransferase
MHHRGASRSEGAAQRLRENGYQAQALDGGFPAWEAKGYPVET